jgi:predicted dehydrogenase
MISALVGYGYWGQVLGRKLESSSLFQLKYICDLEEDTFSSLSVIFTTDYQRILLDDNVKVVFIAVPPAEHYLVAKDALTYGKHVWLEKPCCLHLEEFKHLKHQAFESRKALHLGFISRFSPKIIAMKEHGHRHFNSVTQHRLFSVRENRGHVGAGGHRPLDLVYDLGIHDLSIIKFFYPHMSLDEVTVTFEMLEEGQSKDDQTHTKRWVLELEHASLSATIYLSWCSNQKKRDIYWDDHQSKLRLSFVTSEAGLGSECLFSRDQQGEYEIITNDTHDAIELALLSFHGDIQRQVPSQELIEIAEFCHGLVERLKSSYIEPR